MYNWCCRRNNKPSAKEFFADFLDSLKQRLLNDELSDKQREELVQFWIMNQIETDSEEEKEQLTEEKVGYLMMLGWYVDSHLSKKLD
jgi:hypothetical protein